MLTAGEVLIAPWLPLGVGGEGRVAEGGGLFYCGGLETVCRAGAGATWAGGAMGVRRKGAGPRGLTSAGW
jgi:hypothetical protein